MTKEQLAPVKDVLDRAEKLAADMNTRVYPMHVLAVVLKDDYTTAAHTMKEKGLYPGNVDNALEEISARLTSVSGSHYAVSFTTMLDDSCRLASDHIDGRSNEVRVYDLVVAALADTDGMVGDFVGAIRSDVTPQALLAAMRSDSVRQRSRVSSLTAPVPIIKGGPTRAKHNHVR